MRRSLFAFVALITFGIAVRANAFVDAGKACSVAKVKATAKALVCLAGEQNKILLSKPSDLAKCATKLLAEFSKAEGRTGCLTTGDATSVGALVDGVESEVLTALMAASASSREQKTCVVAKNKAGAKYASCQAKALAKRLLIGANGPIPAPFNPDFTVCAAKLNKAVTAAATHGGCLTLDDAGTLEQLVSRAGAYLPHAPLYGANLTGSNLARADLTYASLYSARLSGANLTRANLFDASLSDANFSGADLTLANLNGASLGYITWSQTICPDGSQSDLNGSSPESCCTNMGAGNVPYNCAP